MSLRSVICVYSLPLLSAHTQAVCGEPCSTQTCVECLPAERRHDIVDFLMQRTLGEIDLSSHHLSERLITLECGHIFTVETLDGHCGMSEYYEINSDGTAVGLKAPPMDFKLPPLCPSCRGSITARRYGRVTKRAILDILEQNVASTMSTALEALNPHLEELSSTLVTLQGDARKIEGAFDATVELSEVRVEAATGKITEPLSPQHLDQPAMRSLHGFSTDESMAWNKVVHLFLPLYRRAYSVAVKRGAHVQAYEAAVTTLYRLELQAIIDSPEAAAAAAAPAARAIEAARRDVGQPPHKADSQFQVEAYFRTLELRFMLAQVAQSRVEQLPVVADDEEAVKHTDRWISFVDFVYKSCEEDAKKALTMARRSSASRQAAQCSVYAIRCDFERVRFESLVADRRLASPSTPDGRAGRDVLKEQIHLSIQKIRDDTQELRNAYMRSRPIQTMAALKAEKQWFKDNCMRKVDRLLKELEDLAEYIHKGGNYEPLSMLEMKDIVKAFDFGLSYLSLSWRIRLICFCVGYSGHFYRCPNGHPYVIGEVRRDFFSVSSACVDSFPSVAGQ